MEIQILSQLIITTNKQSVSSCTILIQCAMWAFIYVQYKICYFLIHCGTAVPPTPPAEIHTSANHIYVIDFHTLKQQ